MSVDSLRIININISAENTLYFTTIVPVFTSFYYADVFRFSVFVGDKSVDLLLNMLKLFLMEDFTVFILLFMSIKTNW